MSNINAVKGWDVSGKLLYAFMTLLGIVMILPLVFLINRSLMPLYELFIYPPRLFVRQPTFKSFVDLLNIAGTSFVPASRYIFNSVVVSAAVVTGSIIIGGMCAYPLAKHKAKGAGAIFWVIVAALMFSAAVTQIPRYLVMMRLGILDTYLALILPALATPLGVFLMKQFMEQIPDQLLESARVDGANEFVVWWKLAMPICRPAWATVAIFSFQYIWNDVTSPSIYLQNESLKTLPVFFSTLTAAVGTTVARVGASMAASVIQLAPLVIMFIILQARVVETMAHSGIK
ncbi:MAG: carbohydrate ABC transporter permease [Patescibacteria group bacterium]